MIEKQVKELKTKVKGSYMKIGTSYVLYNQYKPQGETDSVNF